MTSTQQPLVSVVMPLFNGERYLREAVDSVLAQTYPHWDLAIINNCSTDGSLEIAREYAARDARIRVHSNDAFVRVIENYNIALRNMSPGASYCKPLAADDMLLPECLEKMVTLAEAHPDVAIVGAYGVYSRPEMGVYCRGVPYGQAVLPGRDLCRAYLLRQGPSVWGAPTFILLRAEVVRGQPSFYNESNLHADSESCLDVLEHHDFGFVHQILTFTRVEEGSLTSFSERFNTYLPFRLYALTRYGPKYLSAEEVREGVSQQLAEYYRYLGWQVFKRREPEFWDFHRAKLAAAGHPLNRARLARSAAAHLLGVAADPKRLVDAAARQVAGIGLK